MNRFSNFNHYPLLQAIHIITNVSFLQGWGIVDTISCHRYDLTLPLTTLHDDQFLLG